MCGTVPYGTVPVPYRYGMVPVPYLYGTVPYRSALFTITIRSRYLYYNVRYFIYGVPVFMRMRATSPSLCRCENYTQRHHNYDTYKYLQMLQKFNMHQYVPENVRTCLVNALITTDISDNTDYIGCGLSNNRYNRYYWFSISVIPIFCN